MTEKANMVERPGLYTRWLVVSGHGGEIKVGEVTYCTF